MMEESDAKRIVPGKKKDFFQKEIFPKFSFLFPPQKDSNIETENSQSDENKTSSCDGNQNLSTSAVLAATTDVKLMKKAIKMLKNSFFDLIKIYQTREYIEDGGGSKTDEIKQVSEEIEDKVCTKLFYLWFSFDFQQTNKKTFL